MPTWFFQCSRIHLGVYRHAWCRGMKPQAEPRRGWQSWHRQWGPGVIAIIHPLQRQQCFSLAGNVKTSAIFTLFCWLLLTSGLCWAAGYVLLTSRSSAYSGHEAKLSVELLLMSAKCLGRKQSLSHPEEMSLEKYKLEAWRISLILKKGKLLLTVDWIVAMEE